ncbi:MAG: hypothetical protein OCD02_07085 [Spirochaetaceae bacterium]
MITQTPQTSWSALSKFIEKQTGLSFPKDKWKELERRIVVAAKELEFDEVEPCIAWLLSGDVSKEQLKVLINCLTIGETYFFRDKKSWNFFEQHILKEYIQVYQNKNRRLRIWVAGCSTGEEAYTVAILLRRMIEDLTNWNISILATDINTRSLQKAVTGIYSDWSFRDTPKWLKEKFFIKRTDGNYEVIPSVKEMVTFSYLNLVDDVFPDLSTNTNGMDIIFCRNVLMYFPPQISKIIIKNFIHSLVEHGVFFISAAEVHMVSSTALSTVTFDGASFFRKENRQHTKKYHKPSVKKLILDNPGKQVLAVKSFKPEISERKVTIKKTKKKFKSVKSEYERAKKLFEVGSFIPSTDLLMDLCIEEKDHLSLNGDIYSLLARNLANLGKLYEALEWSEKSQKEDKINPDYYYIAALIHMELGQNIEAISALKKTLFLDSNYTLAYYILGNIRRNEGRIEDSRKQFDNAMKLLLKQPKEERVSQIDGLTVGRLMNIISRLIGED